MKKRFIGTMLAATVAIASLTPSVASNAAGGTWKEDSTGWWYENADGSYAYSEWVDGYWLSSNGYWQYAPVGSWKQDSTGWWYGDTAGYYEKNADVWIDGIKYTFDGNGYLVDETGSGWIKDAAGWWYQFDDGSYAANEWIDGYWLGADGYWTYDGIGSWKQDSTGWWYGDTNNWYAKNETVKIDGEEYTFDDRGYLVNYTLISPKKGAEATFTLVLSSGSKTQAGKDLSALLGGLTADGAKHDVTVNDVTKEAVNKSGTIYVGDKTLEEYIADTDSTTDVNITFDEDAFNVFLGMKLAPGSYNYTVKFGGVTFRNITTTADEITFTANGGTYKGYFEGGVLFVQGDVSSAAWVKTLKDSGVIDPAINVIDHR
ncbi:MAG: hypothetical protein K6E10_06300 [Eubacterium sp.]|nr:hypothetical protein [Eubacterium sp.]